jgi:hypothetical protein
MGEGADLKLGGAEEVLVVGGEEGTGEFFDFGVGGFADGLGEGLDVGGAGGRGRGCWHEGLRGKDAFSSQAANPAFVYKDSTNFQDAHRKRFLCAEKVRDASAGRVIMVFTPASPTPPPAGCGVAS